MLSLRAGNIGVGIGGPETVGLGGGRPTEITSALRRVIGVAAVSNSGGEGCEAFSEARGTDARAGVRMVDFAPHHSSVSAIDGFWRENLGFRSATKEFFERVINRRRKMGFYLSLYKGSCHLCYGATGNSVTYTKIHDVEMDSTYSTFL